MNAPQLPAYLQTRPYGAVSDQLSGSLGQGAPPSLSIMGGRFTLVDSAGGEQPLNTMENGVPYVDALILDSLERISKIYYDHAYDPGQPGGPPTCWSDNGIAPSRNASQPQSPTCAICEKGAWGSAVSKVDPSKKTKACQDYQKLALLVPPNEGIYLLRVPPNSLRNLREYVARFKGSGADVTDIVTRISFERDVLGTLTFCGVVYIDQALAGRRNDIRAQKVTDAIVGRLDQPIAAALAGTAPSPQLAAPAPSQGFQPASFPPSTAPIQAAPPAQVEQPPAGRGRGRGRPRANPNGNQGAPVQTAAPQGGPQPPFPTASNPNPGTQFGIQQGQAPDAGLSAALDTFFGPAPGR